MGRLRHATTGTGGLAGIPLAMAVGARRRDSAAASERGVGTRRPDASLEAWPHP